MLALGALRPAPGWGKPRRSQLTHAEQRTYMTLWCIVRSPLFLGAILTAIDPWTLSLLDNPEVISVDQRSAGAHQALSAGGTVVWISRPQGERADEDWALVTSLLGSLFPALRAERLTPYEALRAE